MFAYTNHTDNYTIFSRAATRSHIKNIYPKIKPDKNARNTGNLTKKTSELHERGIHSKKKSHCHLFLRRIQERPNSCWKTRAIVEPKSALQTIYIWQWWSLETWARSPDPFFEVSVSSRSQSRALRLETLHRLFFMKFCKEFHWKTVLQNDCSKFSRSKRSVAKLSLLLCCLRDGENNLPSTPFKIYTEFNKKCACTNETAARNLCRERLGVLC